MQEVTHFCFCLFACLFFSLISFLLNWAKGLSCGAAQMSIFETINRWVLWFLHGLNWLVCLLFFLFVYFFYQRPVFSDEHQSVIYEDVFRRRLNFFCQLRSSFTLIDSSLKSFCVFWNRHRVKTIRKPTQPRPLNFLLVMMMENSWQLLCPQRKKGLI